MDSRMIMLAAAKAVRTPPQTMILVLITVFVFAVMVLTLLSRIKRCPASKVLVISGKTPTGDPQCVTSGMAFVWPLIQQFDYLDLAPMTLQADVAVDLPDDEIRLRVATSVVVAVSSQPGLVELAAQRVLGMGQGEIQALAREIVDGTLRTFLRVQPIERVRGGSQEFCADASLSVATEINKIGLELISLSFGDILDEPEIHRTERTA